MSKTRALNKVSRYAKTMLPHSKQQEILNTQRMIRMSPHFLQVQFPADKVVADSDKIPADKFPYKVGDRVQIVRANKEAPNEVGRVGKIASLDIGSHSLMVEGLGGTVKTIVPPQAFFEGQTSPIVDFPKSLHISQVRLVASVADEETGREKDVAIHSLKVDTENKYYDADYNEFLPTRVAKHDESIVIPWPRPEKPLQKSKFATEAELVQERTFFPKTILEPPVPKAALGQIRNEHSRHNKNKEPITAEDIAKILAPEMPIPKSKREYLEKRAERFGPDGEKVKHKIIEDPELLAKIEEFVGREIEKGLEKRSFEEEKAYSQYQ